MADDERMEGAHAGQRVDDAGIVGVHDVAAAQRVRAQRKEIWNQPWRRLTAPLTSENLSRSTACGPRKSLIAARPLKRPVKHARKKAKHLAGFCLNDKNKRGRNDPPLAGSAAGAALLGVRLEYTTKEEFEADFEKHRVPAGHPEYGFEVRKRTSYGYPVLDVIRFPERVSFRNLTSGQNRWKE